VTVIVALFSLVLAYFTFREALNNMEIRKTSGASGLLIWPATFVAPLSYLLLAGYLVGGLRRATAKLRRASVDAPGQAGPTNRVTL